jgi:ribose transport system permease protein
MLSNATHALAPRRVSALYLGLVGLLVFAIWIPDLFLTSVTLRTTLADMSITGMAAVAIVMGLAANKYDLAVGWTLGISSAVMTALVIHGGLNAPAAIAVALAVGISVGLVHSVLVVVLKIDSFIVTLGTGAILTGLVFLVSDNRSQFGLPSSITSLSSPGWFGVSKAFYALIVLCLIIWFVLEHTPIGRYTRAIGGNEEAVRLAGVPVGRYVTLALVISGLGAAMAGVFYSASVSGSDPMSGATFLLPAFSAALFGATQIKPGHPNVWGTVLALLALGVWSKGLNLVGVDIWITNVFFGAALIVAVALRQFDRSVLLRRPGRLEENDSDDRSERREPAEAQEVQGSLL